MNIKRQIFQQKLQKFLCLCVIYGYGDKKIERNGGKMEKKNFYIFI